MNFSKLLVVFALFLAFSSCKKEEYFLNIAVDEPLANSTVSNPSAVHVHIDFESSEELHDIEISLRNLSDSSLVAPFTPLEVHEHQETYTFMQDVDLSSYAAGTQFQLEIRACKDHDCTETESLDVTFGI